MTNGRQRSVLTSLMTLALVACGPQVEDDHGAADAAEPDLADEPCEGGECPLACGDRTCAGSLGMGRCIDDKCSPVPMQCTGERSPEDTCTQVCASAGAGVVCVANGCEGATAFGYPGSELEALTVCGESTSDVREAVVPIEGPCDAPLRFSGEGSFALYQCCCDHPDF